MARPFELIWRTRTTFAALYREQAQPDDISLPQIFVLSYIQKFPQRTIEQIVDHTGGGRMTTYDTVDALMALGLAGSEKIDTKKPGPRPTAISITATGTMALKRAERALWNAEKAMLDRLTLKERGALLRALAVIAYTKVTT